MKIDVNPSRAAACLDGMLVGQLSEFEGAGREMLVSPGVHSIKIALPGYETFETAINHQCIVVNTTFPNAEKIEYWQSYRRSNCDES